MSDQKIKILSSHEAQKIAAGEVVERPANIVKELIENSLDAGSTTISLYVEQSGKKLIRVVDDGCGMSPDDAHLCVAAHATSKITHVDELTSIETFGFRGEALASIASVSKLSLTTRTNDDELGTHLRWSDGKQTHDEQLASPVGTDIRIEDLFYNIPARKKFLKRDETEWNHVQALFQAFCLSHLSINFKLYNENKLVINAPAVTLVKDRASQLWDHNFAQNCTPLVPYEEKKHTWLNVSGVISTPHFWRYGRTHMFFFVNNRWIKDSELGKAIMKGYSNVLPPGKFPASFIFLDVDSALVDINVHPKKEEVRFIHPGVVKNAVQQLVKETLEEYTSGQLRARISTQPAAKPVIDNDTGEVLDTYAKRPLSFKTFGLVDHSVRNNYQPRVKQELKKPDLNISKNFESIKRSIPENYLPLMSDCEPKQPDFRIKECNKTENNTPLENELHVEINHHQKKVITTDAELTLPTIIGQFFKTYILIEQDDQIIVIDQHAAHERILYERYLKNFEQKDGTLLMFPEIINVPENDIKLLLEQKNLFLQQGIELDQIGAGQIALKTSPPGIQNSSLKELIFESIQFIHDHDELDKGDLRKKLNEHVHGQMACKAAIKAGDVLTREQMEQLIKDLYKTNNRFICVHGRPTTWVLSKRELEKHFRRC